MRARRWLVIVLIVLGLACSTKQEKDPCKNKEYPKIMKDKTRVDFAREDYYTALEDILEVKRCTPKDPEVYYWLGRIYLARQEKDKAKDNFQIAVKLRSDYPEAHMALGILALEEKDYETAITHFKIAAENELFREAHIAWNNLGWVYLQMGREKEAEQALERSLVLNPNFCMTYCNLGELRSRQKRYQEAEENYKKALELCPELARAHRLLGLEYNRQGKIQKACQEFELAVKYAQKESEEAKLAQQYFELLRCTPSSQ